MYIKTTKEALLKAVLTAYKAVPSKASAPIMETLLFSAGDGWFSVNATDGEISIMAKASGEADGSACLSAKTIVELVKVLPSGDVTIEAKEKSATVTWASGHSEIPTFSPDDFPNIGPSTGDTATFNADEIRTAITHALPHVATDILRPQFTGVHFRPGKDTTEVVGTDTHTICVFPVKGAVAKEFTVSAKSAAAVRDAAAEAEAVSVVVCDNRINFVCGDVAISAQVIIGKFPDYNRIIPVGNANVITADVRSFSQQLRRVAICSNKASNHIRLDLSASGSSVSAQDLGFGVSARENLAVDYEGDDLSIGFKHDLFIKSICVFDCEKVHVSFSDARHAALVTSDDDPAKCVVMPVAIS